jgi:hypothetical protein
MRDRRLDKVTGQAADQVVSMAGVTRAGGWILVVLGWSLGATVTSITPDGTSRTAYIVAGIAIILMMTGLGAALVVLSRVGLLLGLRAQGDLVDLGRTPPKPRPAALTEPRFGITVLPIDTGLRVGSIGADSPAERASLRVGDVIVEVSGLDDLTPAGLSALVNSAAPGTALELGIVRDARSLDLDVTLD